MINLTSPEHIKTQGDFQLNELVLKSLKFDFPVDNVGKKTVTLEFVPCATMDDGDKIYDHSNTKIIPIMDAELYMAGDMDFVTAYFATEKASVSVINAKTEWTATWTAPQ